MKRRYFLLLLALVMSLACAAIAEDKENVDRWLGALGYLKRAQEASAGDTTRALVSFQRANGLAATGEADAETIRVLLGDSAVSLKEYLAREAGSYFGRGALSYGSMGDAVSTLQSSLQDLGYFTGSCDGIFGAETEAAVRRFQLANGLAPDGRAEQAFFRRLAAVDCPSQDAFTESMIAAPGDEGNRVRTLQAWLKELELFDGECTGRYGRFTAQAVASFQSAERLEATGSVDRETARRLFVRTADAAPERVRPDMAAIVSRLDELGYPAHGDLDLQTGLAMLRFRYHNGLPLNTNVNAELIASLTGEGARPAGEAGEIAPLDDDARAHIAADAEALLGNTADFDSSYGLVRYAYLKNGRDLPDAGKLSMEEIEDDAAVAPGDIICVRVGSSGTYGVATGDRAVVFCANNGYIVLRYLSTINADAVYICRPPMKP